MPTRVPLYLGLLLLRSYGPIHHFQSMRPHIPMSERSHFQRHHIYITCIPLLSYTVSSRVMPFGETVFTTLPHKSYSITVPTTSLPALLFSSGMIILTNIRILFLLWESPCFQETPALFSSQRNGFRLFFLCLLFKYFLLYYSSASVILIYCYLNVFKLIYKTKLTSQEVFQLI